MGGETQNIISCPKRAQVIIQSLAPSFSSTFFVKKEPKTPKRERRQREFCKKSNKPPPAGSNFVMVRHRMEGYKMVNIDLLGITVLLRGLCEQGKLTDKEAKRILSRIAVETGADLIISL